MASRTRGIARLAAVSVLAIGLAACQTNGGQKQAGGTLLGAALGALAGSQIGPGRGNLAAVALGTLGGELLGKSVGESLDRADKAYASHAHRRAQAAPLAQADVRPKSLSRQTGSRVRCLR